MSAVDTALIVKLQNSAALTAAAPGGVYRDVAPAGVAEPFVIVTLQAHTDEYGTSGSHYEVGRYLVKAVGKGEGSSAVAAAASAIYAALQDQALSVSGYAHMLMHREERIRYVEIDGSIRWQHNGAIYAVWESRV